MHKLYTLLSACLLSVLCQAFSLDTTSKFWNYTTSQLASTTSQKCKDAYSADIACDYFLVQLVNANEERYYLSDMEPENFTQTCTATCHTSLNDYILNVKEACTERGDAAIQSKGYTGKSGTAQAPVQNIGHILQYHLMRSCAKDEDGENCYITQSSVLPPDFSCDWTCAVALYWNRHFYPYSEWSLGNPNIMTRDMDGNVLKYGNDMLVNDGSGFSMGGGGWETIKECGFGNSTKAPFDIGISGLKSDGNILTSSKSANSTSTSGSTTTSTATVTASGTSSAAPTQTGAAGKSLYFAFSYPAAVMGIFLFAFM
ncbi:hypothetical protein BBP40_005815 [Aspergillus hancockii]|nr:hypothetical protein BBP40_005815 [Aspergillus hancockii]